MADPVNPAHAHLSDIVSRLQSYTRSDSLKAVTQVLTTLLLFIAVVTLLLLSLQIGLASRVVLTVVAALLLLRLFVLQHDCSHNSLFPSHRLNKWVGRLLALLAVTPFTYWKAAHLLHHKTSGNLDRRGAGDIDTLTLDEYLKLGFWLRLGYRIMRNPVFLLTIGGLIHFLVKQRYPWLQPGMKRATLNSVHWTNLALVVLAILISQITNMIDFLIVYIPILWLSTVVGFWLFYLQHHFADAYWASNDQWDYKLAAFKGSTLIDLPPGLRWITANIGIHHIHHLLPSIPNYRLRQCMLENKDLNQVPQPSFKQAIMSLNLALWDEKRNQLISFGQIV